MLVALAVMALSSLFLAGMALLGVRWVGSLLIVVAAAPIAVIVYAVIRARFG